MTRKSKGLRAYEHGDLKLVRYFFQSATQEGYHRIYRQNHSEGVLQPGVRNMLVYWSTEWRSIYQGVRSFYITMSITSIARRNHAWLFCSPVPLDAQFNAFACGLREIKGFSVYMPL